MSFVVSSSNKDTTMSAVKVLQSGGNAFDATLAAMFTSFISEPLLSSPGGGGYLLAKPANQETVLYDFFSQTPNNSLLENKDFYPITGDFGNTTQEFHIGMAACAVPGVLSGIHSIHQDLSSMDLSDLSNYAIEKAHNGVVIDKNTERVFKVLLPIIQQSEKAMSLFSRNGALLKSGDFFINHELATFLSEFSQKPNDWFVSSPFAVNIINEMKHKGGLLTEKDFIGYEVIKRKPQQWSYNDWSLYTNPAPARGGELIIQQLKHAFMQKECFDENILSSMNLINHKPDSLNSLESSKGTTHISVIDANDNVASLTLSNGEGNGFMVPGAGFMLNNFLGEEDLNQKGFFQWPNNQRMTSMMSPCILQNHEEVFAMGTGGSNRIKTSLFQSIYRLISTKQNLNQVVHSPRAHLEKSTIDYEAGYAGKSLIESNYNDFQLNSWPGLSLFFGGINAVQKGKTNCAVGDSRRSGFAYIESDF